MIIVSGADSKIGKNILPILRSNHQVFAIDDSKAEITDYAFLEKIFSEVNPDYFINLKEEADYISCEYLPEHCYNINSHVVKYLSELSKRYNAKIIQLSTCHTYAKKQSNYLNTEESELDPGFTYADSKALSEEFIINSGVDYLIIRAAERFEKKGSYYNQIFKDIAAKNELVLPEEMSLPLVSEKIISDFIIESVENNLSGIYNLSNTGRLNVVDYAEILLNKLSPESKDKKIKKIPYREMLYPLQIPCFLDLSLKKISSLKNFRNRDIITELETSSFN